MAEGGQAIAQPATRRLPGWEVVWVFAVSLGASALFALINLLGSLTAPKALGKQHAVLVGSLAPGRPLLDLALQLASILVTLAPVGLVIYLVLRGGERPRDIGLDLSHPGTDTLRGAALAAVIGGLGLGLYVAAFHLGLNLNVVAESLPSVWWRYPVLILGACQNGILEEVLVVGYLLRRLDQLGWGPGRSLATSAVLRGSYHLYQGFGGFLGNAAMGVVFVLLYRRWGRVTPLIIAHSLIDAVAFTGYAALHGHVSWLP
ncbi:MAG TPA: CPBP family intramembrane glutamic endopeptidase [Streptosporangiaceae bacterium]|nr:CPBP family intramembrane glutamic endopeptidase [Streptosporangiaceae bacterium]